MCCCLLVSLEEDGKAEKTLPEWNPPEGPLLGSSEVMVGTRMVPLSTSRVLLYKRCMFCKSWNYLRGVADVADHGDAFVLPVH